MGDFDKLKKDEIVELINKQIHFFPLTHEGVEEKNRIVSEAIKYLSANEVREIRKGTRVFAVANQKGGVSKTTITSDLLYVLSQKGYRCLGIDLDSQGSLSSLCQVFPKDYLDDNEVFGLQDIYEYEIEQKTERQPLEWEIVKNAICRPQYVITKTIKNQDNTIRVLKEQADFGFDLIPSDVGLADYEQLLSSKKVSNGAVYLYDVVEVIKENADYDFIIIDCPPALSTLCYTGLVAATDGILVPINLEIMALRGTRSMIEAVANVQHLLYEKSDPKVVHKGILGLVKSQYTKTYKVQKDFETVVRDFVPINAFTISIPRATSCDKAHAEGKMFSQVDKRIFCVISDLADEIIARDILNISMSEPVIVEEIGEEAENVLLRSRK